MKRFRTKTVLGACGAALAAVAAGLVLILPAGASAQGSNVDWPYWGGSSTANTRYAQIDQINQSNVSKLGVAFDLKAGPNQNDWETDPIEVNGTLYYTTNSDQVFAVSATTGKKIWSYTPNVNFFTAIAGGGGGVPTSRGLAVDDGKVFDLTFDDKLIALQQATGEKLWSAPVADSQAGQSETSPGTIYKDEYIVGSAESDSGLRGAVQAFNINSGKLLWRTFLAPAPGHGWVAKKGDHGGADVWMPPTIDQATGTVYVGTGNPSPDFDVSVRKGCDPWSDATVALNGSTGKFLWGHTEVCNDGWDYDSHQAPSLYTITQNGQSVPVVGQGNKSGFYSIINEQTGKLIAKSPYAVPYSTPHLLASAKGSKVCPGANGGFEFSPASVDPSTNDVYEQSLVECDIYTTQPQKTTASHGLGQPDFGGSFAPDPGFNASGNLTALNDATGKIAWQDKLPSPAEGGVMTTSGGLVFFGDGVTPTNPTAKLQGWLEAASASTGQILWKADLGVPVTAAPMTYEVNGTQYVALAADSDLVVFKLGGKAVHKLTPATPQLAVPKTDLLSLAHYKKVNPYLYYDAGAKHVVIKMIAGEKKNAGFSFDGYYGGEANFVVPTGWTVTFEFSNVGGVAHSLEVTKTLKTPISAVANSLGIPQAAPADPTSGLKAGAGYSVLTYQPSQASDDYLVCGVVGHLQAGMWDRLTVSNQAKVPSLIVGKPTKKLP
jgi:PQQ-dependent dehydrogenase (methanol/ethanol family)